MENPSPQIRILVKFICSEKATKFCKIFILLLSYVVPVKSKVKILQKFEAFSKYMTFQGVTLPKMVQNHWTQFMDAQFGYL